jgi:hypothetical protein
VRLYSECHFEGDVIEICGDNPRIPDKWKQFRVKSIRVPEGVEVSFFKREEFHDEHLSTD